MKKVVFAIFAALFAMTGCAENENNTTGYTYDQVAEYIYAGEQNAEIEKIIENYNQIEFEMVHDLAKNMFFDKYIHYGYDQVTAANVAEFKVQDGYTTRLAKRS